MCTGPVHKRGCGSTAGRKASEQREMRSREQQLYVQRPIIQSKQGAGTMCKLKARAVGGTSPHNLDTLPKSALCPAGHEACDPQMLSNCSVGQGVFVLLPDGYRTNPHITTPAVCPEARQSTSLGPGC